MTALTFGKVNAIRCINFRFRQKRTSRKDLLPSPNASCMHPQRVPSLSPRPPASGGRYLRS